MSLETPLKRRRQRHNFHALVPRVGNAHSVDTVPTTMLRSEGKEPHRDYHNNPAYRPDTPVDNEIDRSRQQGRRANLDAAFPDPEPGAVPDSVKAAVNRHAGTVGYEKAYKLKLIHRMMLRNLPESAMASALSIDVKTVNQLKQELKRTLAAQAHHIDMPTHVGSALAFYEEVRGVAMQLATDAKHSAGSRVAALGVALESQKDTVRFLQAIGAYQANPMKWNKVDDATVQQGMLLQEMAEAFLSGADDPVLLTANDDGSFTREDEEDIRLINGV